MSGDLISREAAVQMLREKAHGNYPSMFVVTENDLKIVRTAITECANEILQMEAVDAEPVRHERWAHLGGDEWCCTGCGEVIHTEGSWERPTKKYCHECGAKMDKEGE